MRGPALPRLRQTRRVQQGSVLNSHTQRLTRIVRVQRYQDSQRTNLETKLGQSSLVRGNGGGVMPCPCTVRLTEYHQFIRHKGADLRATRIEANEDRRVYEPVHFIDKTQYGKLFEMSSVAL